MGMVQGVGRCDLSEDEVEELCMNTGFKVGEIVRYRNKFLQYVERGFEQEAKRIALERSEKKKADAKAERRLEKRRARKRKEKERRLKEEKERSEKEKAEKDKPTGEKQKEAADAKAAGKDKVEGEEKKEEEKEEEKDSDESDESEEESETVPEGETDPEKTSAPAPTLETPPSSSDPRPMHMSCVQFLHIPGIAMNPLRERIARQFDFDAVDLQSTITFAQYLQVASTFNRPGNKDAKLRLAFKMQDFDGDEKIDAEDLRKYFDLVARNGSVHVKVGRKDVKDVISKILSEASSDPKQKFLSFEDFQRVLATTDFDTNLKLNLD